MVGPANTATLARLASRQARAIRTAISPRLAIRSLRTRISPGSADPELVEEHTQTGLC